MMTPKPFKKLLGFCLRRHAKGGSGPREYKKTKGKLHLPLMTYIKHKSSSLVNFSWKPEETPTMMDSTSDKVIRFFITPNNVTVEPVYNGDGC